jgi:GT2 family glycosyltransferase
MKPEISVIISTFNKLNRLKITLFCLERQTIKKDRYEIIVINDGSEDGTKEFLESHDFQCNVRFIDQENHGQAYSRNRGVQIAKGNVIVFIDDDLITVNEFLKYHLNEHLKDSNQVILGRILRINLEDFDEVSQSIYKNYSYGMEQINKFVKKDLYLDMVERVFEKNLDNIAWICFTGGNSSIRKDNLIACQGFDEQFFRWGPEDIELGYRLFKNGFKFKYCPAALNYHLDVEKSRNQMLSDTARNLKYLQQKYSDNKEILGYINFTSGGASLEEFSYNLAAKQFLQEKHQDQFKFQPFDYINLKSSSK